MRLLSSLTDAERSMIRAYPGRGEERGEIIMAIDRRVRSSSSTTLPIALFAVEQSIWIEAGENTRQRYFLRVYLGEREDEQRQIALALDEFLPPRPDGCQ